MAEVTSKNKRIVAAKSTMNNDENQSHSVCALDENVMISMGGCFEMKETPNGHEVVALSSFPTARLNARIKGGKWYYECHLITDGCMQIGWADQGFVPKEHEGEGLGDDVHSWAYDGLRQRKWNGANSVTYGEAAKWKAGDVVGCCIDIEGGSIRFLLNGKDLGEAYSGLKFRNNSIYPAGSFQGYGTPQSAVFVFDDIHFRHEIPMGYKAINSSKYFKENKYRETLAVANRMCFCFMTLHKCPDQIDANQGYLCQSCFKTIAGSLYNCGRGKECSFKQIQTGTFMICSECYNLSNEDSPENETETNSNEFVCKKVDISLTKIS